MKKDIDNRKSKGTIKIKRQIFCQSVIKVMIG